MSNPSTNPSVEQSTDRATERKTAASPSLSLAFMRSHPAQAARVLESLPPADAAALLARTPARLSAGVLSAMLPRRAASCLAEVDDRRALELLAPMATQPTVALLRHLPESRRRDLIAGLPTAASLASALLLGYTEDTLGAWADPDVVLLPADTRAADALTRMRATANAHPEIFVADASRRLVGCVPLTTLMQAPGSATLATLMKPPAALLPAFTPLSAVAAHPGWRQGSVLPVVEPGDRLVGVMTRDALARALNQAHRPVTMEGAETLPGLLAASYWEALTGVLQGTLALLPKVKRIVDPSADAGFAAPASHDRVG